MQLQTDKTKTQNDISKAKTSGKASNDYFATRSNTDVKNVSYLLVQQLTINLLAKLIC